MTDAEANSLMDYLENDNVTATEDPINAQRHADLIAFLDAKNQDLYLAPMKHWRN